MTLKTTDFVDAQKPILHDLFDTAWTGEGDTYSEICHVEESADAFEKDLQMQSPDEIAVASEGGMYSRVEIENIRTVTYTHSLYKSELKVTREAIEDLRYKQIYDAVKMLGVAAKRTVERKVAAALYNGFSSQLAPDGAAVFSTHTLATPLAGHPTTFSNNSTNGKLTAANLKSMRINGRKSLDENGSISPYKYDRLVVPSALEYIGLQLQAPFEMWEPGSANHDGNVAAKGVKVVVSDWLEEAPSNADTAWFMLDSKRHKFMFFWRVKPQQEMIHEEASGDVLYRVRMRFSVGFSDYRGIEGSQGTGS